MNMHIRPKQGGGMLNGYSTPKEQSGMNQTMWERCPGVRPCPLPHWAGIVRRSPHFLHCLSELAVNCPALLTSTCTSQNTPTQLSHLAWQQCLAFVGAVSLRMRSCVRERWLMD